ncbi:hypothetical protein [Microbispora sp. H10830]|uniref:hypothetical protein n=1 Tax=Microbispora sp. H10830 TaxID=2729109 RepID=UPI00160203E0|nr:hypothetical protein [Microbispora sp. H10830]
MAHPVRRCATGPSARRGSRTAETGEDRGDPRAALEETSAAPELPALIRGSLEMPSQGRVRS